MHIYTKSVLTVVVLAVFGASGYDLPRWAESYGTDTPYPSQTHLTGFGMSEAEESRDEALENARTQAAGDLVRKVRVSIQSNVSTEMRETERSVSSNFNSVNQTVSNLELEGINFEVAEERNTFYALAYVDRRKATEQYRTALNETLSRIEALRAQAAEMERNGNNSGALETYVRLKPLFKRYYEQYALVNILKSSMAKAFEALDAETGTADTAAGSPPVNPVDMVAWEQQAQRKITSLLDETSGSLDDAIRILVKQFEMQDLRIGNNQVQDFRYQDSDFSSLFGSYAARALKREMATTLPEGAQRTITQTYYWDLGDELELSATVITPDGSEQASAQVRVPKSGIPGNLELKPRNFEQALKEQNVLTDETLVDGGINVEIMSDRGGNSESVVLENGQEINFYFRVNQPSYLQLTYVLANGLKVMLWDSYYIGTDRVNKVVNFPYAFEAAPPLGVERLIVTAYSEEPPETETITQSIEGETYDIIPDELSEMLAKTRGLKMKSENTVRVGVADLAITTIPAQ